MRPATAALPGPSARPGCDHRTQSYSTHRVASPTDERPALGTSPNRETAVTIPPGRPPNDGPRSGLAIPPGASRLSSRLPYQPCRQSPLPGINNYFT